MKIFKTLTLCTALIISLAGLSACENTYRGLGHDVDNEEMKDGWD